MKNAGNFTKLTQRRASLMSIGTLKRSYGGSRKRLRQDSKSLKSIKGSNFQDYLRTKY